MLIGSFTSLETSIIWKTSHPEHGGSGALALVASGTDLQCHLDIFSIRWDLQQLSALAPQPPLFAGAWEGAAENLLVLTLLTVQVFAHRFFSPSVEGPCASAQSASATVPKRRELRQ